MDETGLKRDAPGLRPGPPGSLPRQWLSVLRRGCEGTVEAGWLVAAIAVPLHFNPYSSTHFEPDKATLLLALTALVTVAWAAKAVLRALVSAPDGPRLWRRPLVAPALAVLLTGLLSTALSIAPWVSWWGSYDRRNGMLLRLCFFVLFLAIATHLRRPAQWRRLAVAVTLAACAVALYGVVQELGLDPVAFKRRLITSTLGNSIFLGAYLLLALPIAVERLLGAHARHRKSGGQGAAMAVWSLAIALQAGTLIATTRRGPILALAAGLGLVALAIAARLRGDDPRAFRKRRRALASATAVAILVAAIGSLGLAGIEAFRELPVLGRLTTTFDPAQGTNRVRLLIWRGVADLAFTSSPLRDAYGRTDPANPWRLQIGYGPETFRSVFPRVHPAELAQRRPDMVDRAHNELWQRLLTEGAIGLVAWLALVGAALVWALRGAGACNDRRERARLAYGLAIGAALGALLPAVAGRLDFAGVGAGAGLMAGLAIFLLHRAAAGTQGREREPTPASVRLHLALFGAFAAHFIELQFGIGVIAIEMSFWILLGVLAAAARQAPALGMLEELDEVGGAAEHAVPSGRVARALRWKRESVIGGVLTGVALVVLAYTLFDLPVPRATEPVAILRSLVNAGTGPARPLVAPALLTLAAILGLALTLVGLRPAVAAPTHRRARHLAAWLAGMAPALLFMLLHGVVLLEATRARSGADLEDLTSALAAGYVLLVGALSGAVVLIGWLLAVDRPSAPPRATMLQSLLGAGRALAVLVAVVAWLVSAPHLSAMHAEIAAATGRAWISNGAVLEGIPELERAVRLHPREPLYAALLGGALIGAAADAPAPQIRDDLLALSQAHLEQATEIDPYDPRLQVQLARLYRARGAATDAPQQQRWWGRALEAYDRSLALFPSDPRTGAEANDLRGLLAAPAASPE